ncbi:MULTISPECIES: tetratricopeptide repeat protein [unclassified Microcoleus]|uniref:tetratricopeptide repeat protein n=1 Tax=unclassified Microcoleus TaxID=2642155 RepID=UPI002FD1FE62
MAWHWRQSRQMLRRCRIKYPVLALLTIALALLATVAPAGSRIAPARMEGTADVAVERSQFILEKLAQQQEATPSQNDRAAAERVFQEGEELRNEGTAESLRQAIQKYEQALGLLKKLGDRQWEASTLSRIGLIYSLLGEYKQAVDCFNQELLIWQALGDRHWQAVALDNIGKAYQSLGEKQKALDYFNQAKLTQQQVTLSESDRAAAQRAFDEALQLSQQGTTESLRQAIQKNEEALGLWRKIGDRYQESATLNNIGNIYSSLGDKQKALDYYNQALTLWRTLGERTNEAQTLYNIGEIYGNLGERQKALDYYNQALSLYQAVKDRAEEAKTLNKVGLVYYNSGEYQKAIDYLNQGLAIYKTIENTTGIADTVGNLASIYLELNEYQKVIGFYNQALLIYQATGNRAGEGRMLINIGVVYINLRETQKALERLTQALKIWQELKDRRGEAFALGNIGNVYKNLSEYEQALNYYNQAISIFRAIGERDQEAYSLNQIALTYQDMGEMQKSLEVYKQSLAILNSIGNRAREGVTLNNIGNTYTNIGEYQKALDAFTQALLVSRDIENRWLEAKALSNIGQIYRILGETQKALDYYNQALSLHETVGDKEGEAITLNNIGSIYNISGEQQKAIEYYNRALPLHRSVGNRYQEAVTLTNIGKAYDDLGEYQKALDRQNQALSIWKAIGARYGEASSLNNIGAVYRSLGEPQKALEYYNQALVLRRATSDRPGEAFALKNIADVEAALGNLNQALTQIEAAIAIIEKLRTNIVSSDLRTSYFASVQATYGLNIDILMALHRQNPNAGHDIAAFEVSERARARSLIELLNEARADIRQGVEPALRDLERQILQKLTAKIQYQDQLLKNQHTEEQAETIRKEISELETQLQQVEAQIRTASPQYAELTQPQRLNFKEIQQVVDVDTILLSYWLGEERSYVWAVTPTSVTVRELPKRAEIETAALEFYNYLTTPSLFDTADAEEKATTLSQIILAPIAEQLQQKRLLIVGDGELQYTPFSALPVPKSSTTASPKLLIAEHEIVSLPSASTLSIIRESTANRALAPKAVAVLADPVFDAQDERVKASSNPPTLPLLTPNLTRVTESERETWTRLTGTRKEAERILSLVADSEEMQAFDFDANLDKLADSVLSNYRIVHFATHGFFNRKNRQISGIVLSLVNQRGASQNGYLLTPTIFNLNLPAELIVLSGCETGKGENVKGEGIVGLTRGFMYAGAKRVMMSLWTVSDEEGTLELMSRFYEKMLKDGLPAARALREAQLSMMQEGKEPYYWAPFILQGEWR